MTTYYVKEDGWPDEGETRLKQMGVLDDEDHVELVSAGALEKMGPVMKCLATCLRDLASCGVDYAVGTLLDFGGVVCVFDAVNRLIKCLEAASEGARPCA